MDFAVDRYMTPTLQVKTADSNFVVALTCERVSCYQRVSQSAVIGVYSKCEDNGHATSQAAHIDVVNIRTRGRA